MPKMIAVSRAILYTHAHATEDIEKVEQALLNVLPPNIRMKVSIEREAITGFYGNIINRLKVIVEGEDAFELLKYLLNVMDETDRRLLLSTIEHRYDRKSNELYIRLSKQDAYLGVVRLYEGDDVVKVSVSFSIQKSLSAVRRFIEELVKGSTNASI